MLESLTHCYFGFFCFCQFVYFIILIQLTIKRFLIKRKINFNSIENYKPQKIVSRIVIISTKKKYKMIYSFNNNQNSLITTQMIAEVQSFSYEQQLSYLMDLANPYKAETYTKNAILLINPEQQFEPQKLTSDSNDSKQKQSQSAPSKLKQMQQQQVAVMPEIYKILPNEKVTLMNAKKNFLLDPSNKSKFQSCLNTIYLLSIYENVYFAYVVSAERVMNGDNIPFINSLNSFAAFFNCGQDLKKSMYAAFGIVVQSNGLYEVADLISMMKKLVQNNNLSTQAKALLNQITNKKRIILTTKDKSCMQLQKQILQKLSLYCCSPKNLTNLFEKVLSAEMIEKLNINSERTHKKKAEQILDLIKESIERQQIFSEIEEHRNKAIQDQIIKNLPIKSGLIENLKINQHFAIQAAIFVLIDLFTFYTEFTENKVGKEYENYNQQNENPEWEPILCNYSIAGQSLSKLFSKKTIMHKGQALVTAKYFHLSFRMLQNIKSVQIRKFQITLLKKVEEQISSLLSFLFSELYYRVPDLVKDIQPHNLISLTYDIKEFMTFLSRNIHKEPLKSQADDIQDKKIYIVSTFFFSAWKCYQVYEKFWNEKQKNKLMVDLYEICQVKDYIDFLTNTQSDEMFRVTKKMNQYFGDLCYRIKQDYFAVKFYSSSKLNSKVIDTYNRLLQNLLNSKNVDTQIIQDCVQKFQRLGLIEEARKWCYRFMDIIDQNSKFIQLLEDIANVQNNYEDSVLEEIKKLKQFSVELVDLKIWEEIKKELQAEKKLEEWLIKVQTF